MVGVSGEDTSWTSNFGGFWEPSKQGCLETLLSLPPNPRKAEDDGLMEQRDRFVTVLLDET